MSEQQTIAELDDEEFRKLADRVGELRYTVVSLVGDELAVLIERYRDKDVGSLNARLIHLQDCMNGAFNMARDIDP
jgi:pyruvate dehydrogenase complex dehydrogenase (E1) component